MSKRGENIHKRKDGRWEGRFEKGRKPNGAIIYGSVYGKTYREVKEKLTLAAKGAEVPLLPKNRVLYFKEVLLLWMEHNRIHYKGATAKKNQDLIDTHINPALGDVKITKITATMINSFAMKKMQNGRLDGEGGLSAAYVRNMMLIISSAMKYAADEQMCLPLKTDIFMPVVPKKDLPILSLTDQKKLENHLLLGIDPTRIGVLLSLYTGLRIGEVCALSWEDIDFENNIIHVRHTVSRVKNTNTSSSAKSVLIIDEPKTESSTRDIPIASILQPVLKQIIANASSKYVISEASDFLSPRTLEYRYHRLLDASGVESINFHALRHTFATRCVEAGMDIKTLSEILGHSDPSITLKIYVHSSIERKRNQLEKLTEYSA